MTGGFVSLRWRLMAPLVAVWAAGMVLLVAVLYTGILERFRTLVDQRADTLVSAVYSAAESAREPADLRRFVSTLGASRDVARVVLAAGEPPRVIASTDHGWHDRSLDTLPDPSLGLRLKDVLAGRKGDRTLDADARTLDVLEPVLLVGVGGENGRLEDGVLFLRLDAHSLWQATLDTVLSLSLGLGAIFTALVGLIYLLVSRYVLEPADGIREALGRRAAGEPDALVPVAHRDELGQLATALNELLSTLREQNLRLARTSNQQLAMLEAFPHLAWRAGVDGACDWFNRAWLAFTGKSLEAEVGAGWLDGVHPDDRDACLATYRRSFDAREAFAMEYRLRNADGSYHWIADHGAPIDDGAGVFAGYIGSCYDLQPARDNARDIKRMTRLYHALSATNKAIVHAGDAASLLPEVCRIAVELGELDLAWIGFLDQDLGMLRVEAVHGREGPGESVFSGAPPQCYLPGEGVPVEAVIVNDTRSAPASLVCAGCAVDCIEGSFALFPIHGPDGPDGALVLRKAEAGFFDAHTVALLDEMATDIGFALRNYRRDEALRLAARVFENNSEGVVITDPSRQVVMVNRAFCTLTGFAEADVQGKPLVLLDPDHHPRGFASAIRDSAVAGEVWQGEVWMRRAGGQTFPAALTVSAVRNADGGVGHFLGVFSDISQRKADEAQIRFLASHDFLTGLPSRAMLEPTVAAAISAARAGKLRVALCFLDLDRFKNVNDTLGHHIGDQLLVEVGQRLQSVLGERESVLRHGGDEFVVVMPDAGERAAVGAAAMRLIAAMDAPFRLAGCEFSLSASIGIAIYPDDGDAADVLLDRADVAMYRAKEEGRNAVQFFADGMAAPTSERLSLEHALRRALERDELALHYQPVVSAASGELIGAEALLRWTHPELGPISPGSFIPLAEESGLILPIGNWVLDTVCGQIATWQAEGRRMVPVAANISALQFRRPDFVATVADALRRHAIPASLLTLELTESMVMGDVERAARQLAELKALGLSLAIDDFGTGYSSLAYLKRFPLDKLKVDQSFVREINEGPEDRAIVAAIVGLGHNLGVTLVAEGVETRAMAETLRELGCDALQGWLFGRAEPAAEFAARLG